MAMVLDAWALMAFFLNQAAAQDVQQILDKAEDDGEDLLLTAVNWGEIFYSITRAVSENAAEDISHRLAEMPIRVIPIAEDLVLVRQAAKFKAGNRISYADCFAAALAKLTAGVLVTGDKEFRPLEKEFKIHWLPS
jgi:predicted nucleic acid-binding protein